MRVLSTVPYTALRLLRDYISLLLLLIVPLVLITVFAFIFNDITTETGVPVINESAILMTLAFQFFGGAVVMAYIHPDFFSERKERIQVLPFNRSMYAFSISMCGTLYSIMLGLILVIYSELVLGVDWGSWLWALFVISLMAILSSIICLIFVFSVKSYKIAERLSEVYGVGFIVLAGLFFPMPDHAFFTFVNTYINPLVLSAEAIWYQQMGNGSEAWFNVLILIGAIIVTFMIMFLIGRRKIK
ncbi:ABC transporter permease [Alkalihalobacillus sp. 1P02AB]|uniref:ABC transporter permease n=1 Tax=Alkalihalobacillus sp. 1P02AB TaxID=3132260 RepID=UPI0039A442CC